MRTALKHRWSLGHNYLAGITADQWWRLLRENRFAVDPAYWHRAAFITVTSLLNSVYRRRENSLYREAVAETRITDPPLFILGHWRSGTTLLHNLMAQDTENFAYANTYQVVNPHTFLCTEDTNTKRFAWMVPRKRLMDDMELSFQSPQEDEFAPCLMTLHSLYIGISFARREDHYSRYFTFKGVDTREVEAWKTALLWFVKKLTYKYRRPLLLKSPPHTARIPLLLEMFPEARFVHIHRHPYSVFPSCRHYFDTAMWYTYLQRPDLERVDERIIRRYQVLYDAFFEDRHLIPPGRLHEMRFEDLERDPINELRRLYEQLDLPLCARIETKLQAHVDGLAGYRKNTFVELEPGVKARLATAWARSFETLGYRV